MGAPPRAVLLACEYCDLLHADVRLRPGTTSRCRRCGSLLARNPAGGGEGTLALALAAVVVFFVANSFPLVILELGGQRSSATLIGAAARLGSEGMWVIAGLVLFTTVVCPLGELLALCYLLLPLSRGMLPPGFAAVMRLLHQVRPWGMLEVFVLGSLICLAKLIHIATVVPGIGLWAFGALMILTALAAISFDADALWRRADRIAGAGSRYAVPARRATPAESLP